MIMEMSIQSSLVSASLVLTGLSAGLFFGWSVSVIPGTQKINDLSYLNAMQSINQEILNPGFFIVFLGSLIALMLSTYFMYPISPTGFGILLIATLTYMIGTIGVTVTGNVPLNNKLEALKITDLTSKEITEFRQYYELRWNRLHTCRMLFSVLSFILTLLALNLQLKN